MLIDTLYDEQCQIILLGEIANKILPHFDDDFQDFGCGKDNIGCNRLKQTFFLVKFFHRIDRLSQPISVKNQYSYIANQQAIFFSWKLNKILKVFSHLPGSLVGYPGFGRIETKKSIHFFRPGNFT